MEKELLSRTRSKLIYKYNQLQPLLFFMCVCAVFCCCCCFCFVFIIFARDCCCKRLLNGPSSQISFFSKKLVACHCIVPYISHQWLLMQTHFVKKGRTDDLPVKECRLLRWSEEGINCLEFKFYTLWYFSSDSSVEFCSGPLPMHAHTHSLSLSHTHTRCNEKSMGHAYNA